MDIIPGDVNSRFMFIHVLLMVGAVGAWCTFQTLRRERHWVRLFLCATGYVALGILYLIALQSRVYRDLARDYPLAARAFQSPVWLFCAVDHVLAPHAGGTAIGSLVQ